jgi:hypothetical protein
MEPERQLCHVMCKGQDTTVLPLLAKASFQEEDLKLKLKNLCNMGLRTMAAGYAELSLEWWFVRLFCLRFCCSCTYLYVLGTHT